MRSMSGTAFYDAARELFKDFIPSSLFTLLVTRLTM